MSFKKSFVMIMAILSIFFVSSCKKKQATIEFLPGMGNQTMNSIQVDMNSEYVLPTPTFSYEGYTFDCWVLSSDATQTFKVGDTFVVGEDSMYSFTGTWLPNKTTYKVNLWFEKTEEDGYELFSSDEYSSSTGAKVGVRADFYDCMIFEESKSVSEAVVKADGTTSLDLYYRRTRYSITFDGDGGELTSGVVFQVLKFQQQPKVPVFTKVGFDFVGWNKEISEATEDVVYKAVWKEQKIEKVAITNTTLLQDLPISNIELTCSVTTSKPNYVTPTFEIVSMVPSDMGATISNNLLNVNFAGKVGIKAICEGVESEIVYFEFSKKLSEISLDSTNNIDLEYYQYQSIDYGTAKLLLTYSDTSTELIELLPSYLKGFDTLTTGDKTFTIEYLDFKHTYEYKVIPVSVGLNFVDHSTYYSLNGIGDCKDTLIIVPSIYNQKPVKVVAEKAFFENTSITSVIFTGGVETIGDYAFSKCSNLSSVILSDSVISIATNGFSNCINLKVFECGNALESIGQFGFNNCVKLEKIVLPNTLNNLSTGVFEHCSELREVTLSNSLDIINLQVFSYCVSLTSIVIPDSVLSIEQNAFENCEMLATVNFGNQLKTIGVWAFSNCKNLKEAIFPDSLESIQNEAFLSCSKLSNVHFGKNFDTFGSSIFNNCGNIKTCTIDKENTCFSTTGNCIIHIKSKTLVLGFASTVIPSDGSVEIIGNSSFSGIEALSAIVIPEGIIEIGESAFDGCTNLAGTITIPNSVTKIGSDVFRNCSSLEGIILPDSIKEIPINFCFGCKSLKTITMSDEVTSIKAYAFYDCSNLELTYLPEKLLELGSKSLYVSNLNTTVVNNVLYAGSKTNSYLVALGFKTDNAVLSFSDKTKIVYPDAFRGNSIVESLVIPNSIEFLGSNAFLKCTKLSSVTFGTGIKKIEYSCFGSCTSLKSVTLPEGITILSNDVFNGCVSLTSVNLPSTLQSIGEQAFMGCSSLTEISIPKGIVTIETYTFADCTNLAKVYFLGHIENLNQSCFNNCKDDIVFNYVGSIAEWKLVKKNMIWCTAKNKLIKCSDGEVNS